jgi:hypothetical protein
MLLGLCQDVKDGRFPLIQADSLIEKTRKRNIKKLLMLTRKWVLALKEERLHHNVGAIYWTKLLEAFPNFLEGDIPEEAEDWPLQLKRWRG